MGKKLKITPAEETPRALKITPAEEDESTRPLKITPVESPHTSGGFFGTLRDAYQSVKNSFNTQVSPEQEALNKEQAFGDKYIKNAFERGRKASAQAEIVNPYGIDKTQSAKVAQLQKEIEELPSSKAYQEFTTAPTFGDAAKAFSKNPLKILTELSVESMTSMVDYGATRVGAGAAMGAAGGTVVPGIGTAAGAGGGAIVGLADTSLALEYSSSILDSFKQAGVDVTNPEELQKAFENDTLVSNARAHAYKKAIPIALFDLVSGGVAGKIVSRPSKSLLGTALKGAGEFGLQAGMGMAGEAAGELTSGEDLQPGAILAEGLGEFGMTPVETAFGLAGKKPSAAQKQTAIDNIITKTADIGDNQLNAEIDSESITNGKTTSGKQVQGTEPQTNQQTNESSTQGLENKEVLNAEAIRSDEGQVPEAGTPSEASQTESSEDLQQPPQEEPGDAQKQVEYEDALDKVTKLQQKFAELPIDQNADELLFDLREARRALAKIAGERKPGKKTNLQRQIEKSTMPTKQEPVKVNPASALKEQIKAHYNNISKGVKKGKELTNDLLDKITEVSKEHSLSPKQMNVLVNKVKRTNLFTPGSVSKLNALVDKIANDADYAESLDEAETLRKKIKKKSSNPAISIEVNNTAKAFSKIDPSSLSPDNLDVYKVFAEDLDNHYRSPGNVKYAPAKISDIEDFVSLVNRDQRSSRVQEVRDQYGFGKEVSDADIESYLQDEENEEEDPFNKNHTEANEKAIRDKILKTAEYSQLGLKNFANPDQQEKINSIANMDLTQLDNSQLVDYIRTVDNMIENEDFSNTDKLQARAKALEGLTQLKELVKNEDLVSLGGLKRAVYSLPQIFKAAYKSSELAAEAYRLTGLADYYNSTSRVESQEGAAFKDFQTEFDRLNKKYKDFDKPQTQVNEAVFGNLVRYPKGADPTESLTQSKRNIEASIPKLEQSGHKEIAADVKTAYEKFKNAETIQEVFDIMKKESPGAFEMWEWWKNKFDTDIKNRLKKVAGEFHNENFVEEENYTPKKFITVDNSISSPEDKTGSSSRIGQRKQSNTAKAATNRLQKNQALNFNFYEAMYQAYRESLYDIETTRPQQVLHEFFKLPESAELLGGLDNKRGIIDNFHKSELIARSYGQLTNEATKFFDEISNAIRTISYTRALGGVTQFIKQYPSVAISSLANLGTDSGLFFTRIPEGTEKLLNQYTIGQRGKRRGGLSMGESLRYKVQSAYQSTMLKVLGKTNKIAEIGSKIFMKSLTAGDVNIAQRSWVAYYLQSLKNSGVDLFTVDLSQEHSLQNQEERKKAAAFAEQKVKETQVVSNPEESGTYLKTLPGAETMLKNILLPFSSFQINTKIRLVEGMNRIRLDPTNPQAYKELGAVTAEIFAFTTLRYYVIQAAINTLVKPLVESMFSLKGLRKKEKDEDDLRFKKWYSDIIKDMVPTAVGTGATAATVNAINWIGWLVENPRVTFEEWRKQKKEWVYNYKGPTDLGLYSSGISTIQDFINNAKLNYDISQGQRLSTVDDYGEHKMRLSESQKTFMKWANLADVLAVSGFMDADTYNLIQKIRREQIKQGVKRAQ